MILDLRNGDCVDILSRLDDNSVSAILCDPPYGLKFMGKAFDNLGDGRQQINWHIQWLSEAYRVLKFDGIIRAFCGTRTLHYLLAAMAETGFHTLQVETWHYVNGFPKSLDISKEYDRIEGKKRDIVGWTKASTKGVRVAETRTKKGAGSFGASKNIPITIPKGFNAKNWKGYHTALKPSFEPICVGVK